jgi:hypothetical protein
VETGVHTSDRKTLILLPAQVADQVLMVEASLKPANSATGIEDDLFDQYVREIAAGAVAALKEHADKTYTDPVGAAKWRGDFNGHMSGHRVPAPPRLFVGPPAPADQDFLRAPMTAPTVAVTVSLDAMGGPALAGVVVHATLDKNELYGGVVISKQVRGTTDVNGDVVLHLFPNAPAPAGLGTQGSTYRVTATVPGGRPLNVQARVPNAACNLHEILVDDEAVPLDAAEIAISQAQGAVTTATAQAGIATAAAATATAQAGIATGAAGTATAQAAIATTKAGEAAASAAAVAHVYPGAYAVAPATRPDGSARQAGDLYFGTDGLQRRWDGAAWLNIEANAAASAASALASKNAAGTSEVNALASKNAAGVSETNAANYAAAAATGAKFFDTIALGLAGVANGNTFGVKPGGADALARPTLYRNDAGVATLLYTVLPAAEFDAEFSKDFEPGVSFAICDANNNAAFLVYTDGSIKVTELTVTKLNGVDASAIAALVALTNTTEVAAFSIVDANGKVALEVASDGTVHVSALVVDTNINGVSASNLGGGATTPYAGNFSAELVYFNNDGQSLGEGSYGNNVLTAAQEFDSIGFPAAASNPGAYLPLTVANTQAFNPPGTGRGESPLYGALASIKERIAAEVGLAYTDQKYQLIGCNNAIGGAPITGLNKGTGSYTAVLSQVSAAYAIAQAEGRTFKAGATFWTQGENYTAGYQAALQQLANDFDADMRAITGQTEPVLLICYQTPTSGSAPALDQLAAHDANSKIFIASPAYFLNFGDGQHIDATSARILGAYYGICYKRVAIDGIAWEPLRPISHTKQGKILTVKFHVPKLPLVLDSVLNPLQANYGFTMVDGGGAAIAINSVSLVEPDTVKIVTNVAIPAGALLKYALNAATGKGPFVGGCGNLRDSQGASITFRTYPMHNWCVMFQRAL